MLEKNKIYNGDCLEVLKDAEDKSIDLIVVDPPYNIGKSKEWDKWKKQSDYVSWCGEWFLECQRVLKDNGSFYFFHNDFLQIVELQNFINKNTKFVFKQLIVWNKKFEGYWHQLNAVVSTDEARNYSKQAEYCLYYTFQDETGLTTVMLDTNNFPTLRNYFKGLQEFIGINLKKINNTLGHRKAEHCFYWKTTQWDLPTEETYNELIKEFGINKWACFKEYESLRQEYESLRQEYESLRQEYESLRYTFNNQKTHHSVWNYEIAKKESHITPKPINLIENIIKHSSNENDTILDCFSGSGTTAIACINTNRNYICIEKDKTYFDKSVERIEKHLSQTNMFRKVI